MSILSDITISELCGVDLAGVEQSIDARMEPHAIREMQWRVTQIENNKNKPMISPFVPNAIREEPFEYKSEDSPCSETGVKKIVSYGLSAGGYDVRLAHKFKIFTNVRNALIDPLNVTEDCYVEVEGDHCIIPPNSYILGHTMETFDIPRDVMAICLGKSTYARLASIVNVTPIEPGFKGDVVIEIANCSPLPLKVYAGQGIAQFVFFKLDRPCKVSYADKGGKYQGQSGLTTARL